MFRVNLLSLWFVAVLVQFLPPTSLGDDRKTTLTASTDFEGGSARILSLDSDSRTISLAPGGDPDRGWPCWWSLRIDGLAAGETATLKLSPSLLPARYKGSDGAKPLAAGWAMPDRASVSIDGRSWKHTSPGTRTGDQMSYEVVGSGGPVWVAWGPPFTPNDTERLIVDARNALSEVRDFELCQTRAGRPVRGLHIAAPGVAKSSAIWIQARQHAWESGSSWVARGLVEWLVSEDADAKRLRARSDVFVVPIMDVDNVATGDGGKEAIPRDHNRDWDQQPVYPEVAAAQSRLTKLTAEGRLRLFVDLHNPAPADKRPFFFVGPPEMLSEVTRAHRERFIKTAARHINDPLPLLETPRITGPGYHPLWRQISGQWVNDHGLPQTVAVCLETSWNTPHSTTEGYRTVGKQLGQAIAEYVGETEATVKE